MYVFDKVHKDVILAVRYNYSIYLIFLGTGHEVGGHEVGDGKMGWTRGRQTPTGWTRGRQPLITYQCHRAALITFDLLLNYSRAMGHDFMVR